MSQAASHLRNTATVLIASSSKLCSPVTTTVAKRQNVVEHQREETACLANVATDVSLQPETG